MRLHGITMPSRLKIVLVIAGVVMFGIGAGVSVGWYLAQRGIELPAQVTNGAAFKAHLPRALPQGFVYDPKSAVIDDGVLAYVAARGTSKLVFSEQTRPAEKKIDNFYTENTTNRKTLTGTPYQSVLADSLMGGKVLSVTTDKTWLIISSSANDAESLLQFVARNF